MYFENVYSQNIYIVDIIRLPHASIVASGVFINFTAHL